ncbi:MAG: CHAD domain-containing protein [Candidatus Sumerlaeia bacterium]
MGIQLGELESICEKLPGGSNHALEVALFAKRIFKACSHLHGLSKPNLKLLKKASLLCRAVDLNTNDQDEKVNVMETLRETCPEFSESQLRIIDHALRIFYEDFYNQHNLEYEELENPEVEYEIARRMAAILGIAYALDSQECQDSQIMRIRDSGEAIDIWLNDGLGAHQNAGAAMQLSSPWNRRCLRPVRLIGVLAEDNALPKNRNRNRLAGLAHHHLRKQFEQCVSRSFGLSMPSDVEYVHEMRVALRRSRAVLQAFGKAFDDLGDDFKDDLKDFGKSLGTVRDKDVFLKYLEKCRQKEELDKPFLAGLIGELREEREIDYAKVREEFQNDAFRNFQEYYMPLLQGKLDSKDGISSSKWGRKKVKKKAGKILKKRLKKVLKYDEDLSGYDGHELHRLRIKCKKLRYPIEFLEAFYGNKLKPLHKKLKKLQDTLGEVHDCDVFASNVREYGEEKELDENARKEYEALLEQINQDRADALESTKELWATFLKKKKDYEEAIKESL